MNSPTKSFYVLAINDHILYRINHPIKLHKWYHTCQSWNGKTGEWQLWVNGERVGRGYYNLVSTVLIIATSSVKAFPTEEFGRFRANSCV